MATALPAPRGLDLSLPTCGETQCSGRGTCAPPPGGGANLVCDCHLGYQGESCEDTVNGALSLPLTLSVLAVIVGVVLLAFVCAKVRQFQKKKRSLRSSTHCNLRIHTQLDKTNSQHNRTDEECGKKVWLRHRCVMGVNLCSI
ncbi:Hypothetical protein SMAX5B_015110 [Scophthalmus maximus]|uniref:EGF-like domain-containing protein n=1 Tax=Scophthalmus maximus TaxID=52904 RepID=A0A2U9CGB3_SCOMX|nr:Hypothetical protein SMAX5B_015110 [Scophthalmus maximus]